MASFAHSPTKCRGRAAFRDGLQRTARFTDSKDLIETKRKKAASNVCSNPHPSPLPGMETESARPSPLAPLLEGGGTAPEKEWKPKTTPLSDASDSGEEFSTKSV